MIHGLRAFSGRLAAALPLCALLTACAVTPTAQVEAPPARVSQGAMPAMPAVQTPSYESTAARKYYARIEAEQVARGLMRVDGGGPDAPFDASDLQQNFERVALFNEYVEVSGQFVAQQTQAQLRRWESPVRIKVHFGNSLPAPAQARDTALIQRYVTRLARTTRHPITLVSDARRANFHIFVVSVDEQRNLGPLIKAVEPKLGKATINEMTNLPRNNFCAVYASSSRAAPHVYVSAIALVRTEHPDLMRDACYHEEIAQGLGLANDSPLARPSIFNDDEEFAFLTSHDEALLGMLYDPRLKPGMTPEQARPIVARLARERAPGGAI
jgi:hypothetical protein